MLLRRDSHREGTYRVTGSSEDYNTGWTLIMTMTLMEQSHYNHTNGLNGQVLRSRTAKRTSRPTARDGMRQNYREFHGLLRTAQAVLHTRINDRNTADQMGHGIVDFALTNWGTVTQDFGDGAQDEMEIIERVTRVVLRELHAA